MYGTSCCGALGYKDEGITLSPGRKVNGVKMDFRKNKNNPSSKQ